MSGYADKKTKGNADLNNLWRNQETHCHERQQRNEVAGGARTSLPDLNKPTYRCRFPTAFPADCLINDSLSKTTGSLSIEDAISIHTALLPSDITQLLEWTFCLLLKLVQPVYPQLLLSKALETVNSLSPSNSLLLLFVVRVASFTQYLYMEFDFSACNSWRADLRGEESFVRC